MTKDLTRRLERLEAVAAPEPIPPEIWFVDGDRCHMTNSDPITRAELEARPNTSSYPRIFFMRDDEENAA